MDVAISQNFFDRPATLSLSYRNQLDLIERDVWILIPTRFLGAIDWPLFGRISPYCGSRCCPMASDIHLTELVMRSATLASPEIDPLFSILDSN
jgi:hypothetical protein